MRFFSIRIFCFVFLFSQFIFAQEGAPSSTDNSNWLSSISYDITGTTLSKSVSFYNTLGKPTQSQSWDILSGKVWASETLYDSHGRSAFQTLSAPVNETLIFGYDDDFIKDNTSLGTYDRLDFDWGPYIDNPREVKGTSKLGKYYWNSTTNEYQDNTKHPFSRTIYSKLNPGSSKKVLGGNKINGKWLQSYTFSMVGGIELSSAAAFGSGETRYDNMRITKTVSRDVHGVEAVVFTDSDGNTLAAARSGNEEQSGAPIQNKVILKEQGFVDIHIPYNCTGISIQNTDDIALEIYDLVTENSIAFVSGTINSHNLSPGFYRIAVRYPESYDYNNQQPISITHTVNYFDYALNYYDKAGRLLESTQPNSKNLKSKFKYNTLGQLLKTTSPDEGTAQFIYRKDGQIRFSQNSKQQVNDAFSYTNYDRLGRPLESGEYRGLDIPFYLAPETTTTVTTDPVPAYVTVATSANITSNSSLPPAFTKTNIPGNWNGGFVTSEVIEENGQVEFALGTGGNGPSSSFGDYGVVVGLSPTSNTIALDGYSYGNIKYGIRLINSSGLKLVQIHENGDFLRDGNNQIISFNTYSATDTFSVERTDGVITYLKNSIVFHTTADNYLEPLAINVSFGFTYNTINSVMVSESSATPATPSGTDIQSLVDLQDGLSDKKCYEQHFTLYDIPDRALEDYLNKCGLPSKLYKQTFLSGNVSKTYTKSPETTTTWYSYDVYGRVKWLIQSINGLDCLKTIDYSYDAVTGQVLKVDYQQHNREERFIHQYEYNVGGQLVKVNTSLDNEAFEEQAEYKYNETGALIRTELADNLQGIDYIYNLQGQLKAINHPSLNSANDPGHDGTNGFAGDVFGMILQYYDGDYTRTNTPTPLSQIAASTPSQFNGNIQAVAWQNETGQASTYAYAYNKNNWLTGAEYSNPNTSNAADYKVSNITYDANGNIQSLKRNGVTNTSGSNAMDDFTYHYSYNNQLDKVTDANDNPDPTRYNDLKSQGDDNYIYNSIGQLVISNQDKALYEYNASGLVTKINALSSTATNTYYSLLAEDYQNEGSIRGVQTVEGLDWIASGSLIRGVFAHQADQNDTYIGLTPIGVDAADIKLPDYCLDFDNDTTYENRYQFNFYSDVRPVANTYTLQTNVSTTTNAYHNLSFDLLLLQKQYVKSGFGNPITAVAINAGATIRLKQLDGTLIDTYVIDAQNATQSYCDRIVDNVNFSFLATGNKVFLEVDIVNDGQNPNGYFGNPSVAYSSLYQSAEVDNFKLEVATSAKLAFYYNDRGQRVRKEEYGAASSINSTYYVRDVAGSPMAIYQGLSGPTVRSGPPTAREHPVYGASRIGVFNRDSGSRAGGSYVYQLTDHLGNVRAVITKVNGNAVSLTQKTDYYPFGMPMPNRNVEGDYRYGYQGEFAEKEPELGQGINSFQLRLYDSRIGRWTSPDPMGEFFSPYLAMGNNPISLTDPTGGCTDCPDPVEPSWGANINTDTGGARSYAFYDTSGIQNLSEVNLVGNRTQLANVNVSQQGFDASAAMLMTMQMTAASEAYLIGNDVTVIGVADDFLIPVVGIVGLTTATGFGAYAMVQNGPRAPSYMPTTGPISTIQRYDVRPTPIASFPAPVLAQPLTANDIALVDSYIHQMAQRGGNNGKLEPEELERLLEKEALGTLTKAEKQKLKKHRKNTGERGSRRGKGGSKR